MKKTIGLIEKVKIVGKKTITVEAICDTGARTTSVDVKLASKAGLGPIIGAIRVKNPSLKNFVRRPLVKATLEIAGQKFTVDVNIQDRSHMNFPMIIGRNIMNGEFIVDPEKHINVFKKRDENDVYE